MSFRPGDGGKGSGRRPGNGYADGFDRIFGNKAKPASPPVGNVRHDLSPALVQVQIESKIAKLEEGRIRDRARAAENVAQYEQDMAAGRSKNWVRRPTGPEQVDAMIDGWIEQERAYYAKVRVIELPQPGKRFILVYGDANDATVTVGTGPAESVEKAASWFFNGGR